MDFQAFVDCCSAPCAVLKVEKTPEGYCGPIHIICSNQAYKETMGPAYYDGMPYEELAPKDLKFEDYCFRAAHLGQRMHAYVETKALGCWTDQVMIPLQPQTGDVGYCQFVFEFTKKVDASRMANVSIDTAEAAIKACVTLMGAEDFKASVYEVLGEILDVSEAFSSRILLVDHDRREAPVFCDRHRDESEIDWSLGDGIIPYEIAMSWEEMIGVSNAIIVKDEREMANLERRNPGWVRSMRHYDVHSLVLIPLRRAKEIFGYLYVVNFNIEKTVIVKELIELVSFFLGSEISNYLLMSRLEDLSTKDSLTGLFNRNAMMRRLEEHFEEEGDVPFGVISVDLNGLKGTNDREGHDAGDRLLVEAAGVLSGVFRKGDLYRMGGDEFAVLAINISRDVFEQRVEQLRAAVEAHPRVSFAIGSYWTDGSMDPQEAMRLGDQSMYEDKRAYYEAHPEARR